MCTSNDDLLPHGVRQERVVSPLLFNLYVNAEIVELNENVFYLIREPV